MSNNDFTILIIPYNVTQANDWPQVFDDSLARKDWGWSHQTGIDDLCEVKISFKVLYWYKKHGDNQLGFI